MSRARAATAHPALSLWPEVGAGFAASCASRQLAARVRVAVAEPDSFSGSVGWPRDCAAHGVSLHAVATTLSDPLEVKLSEVRMILSSEIACAFRRLRAKSLGMESGHSIGPLTSPGLDTAGGTQGMEIPSKAGDSQESPAFCLELSSLSSSVSQAERGASEPNAGAFEVDFAPEVPRSEPQSLLLETRGVTSHLRQTAMWEREIVWKESILAKLKGISRSLLAGKMAECHQIETYKRCTGCRKVSKFYNRCELFFCPVCAPRLSRERKQAVEWWSKQVNQPKHLVLTVRNTASITQLYVKWLKTQLSKLRRSKIFSSVKGGFYSMEVTNEGKGWHVHFHLLIDTPWLCMPELSQVWGKLVGQDFAICKIKDCRGDDYLREVTKYAVKGSELAKWDGNTIAEFIETFTGVRFFGVFGSLYGKRTEWREWIKSIQDIKPLCSCGCDTWKLLSPEELLWEEETKAGLTSVPPPTNTQIPIQQPDLELDGLRSLPFPR